MDLTQFQFDFDLTFAMFFMNADKTVYGRYGTRSSHDDTTEDMSLEGLAKAMSAALELHRDAVLLRTALAGKKQVLMPQKTPEEFPSLARYKPDLDYQGKVAQSCMHCHQVRDAQRRTVRDAGQPLSDELLFPYPKPDVLGLVLDPMEKAKVSRVIAGSRAEQDGFQVGDEIARLAGQPIISIADVQWVLHTSKTPAQTAALKVPAEVLRGGKRLNLELTLAPGWRRGDISWRTTTWDLRRMVGGMLIEDLPAEERTRRDLPADSMALLVKHVGQFGEHQVAKQAGLQKDDVIVAFDGISKRASETDVLAHAVQSRRKGDKISIQLLRGEKKIDVSMALQ